MDDLLTWLHAPWPGCFAGALDGPMAPLALRAGVRP